MGKFFRIALRDWATVGALFPTSRYVVRKVVEEITADHKFVIECGAGSGTATQAILSRLSADAQLLAVEIKPEFMGCLGSIRDSRLRIVRGDARDILRDVIRKGYLAHAVVTNIPFTRMSRGEQDATMRLAAGALRPGGTLVVYQNFPLGIVTNMRKYFRITKWKFEWRDWNFPYFFIVAEKK